MEIPRIIFSIFFPFISFRIFYLIHFNKIDFDKIKSWEYIFFWPWIYSDEVKWLKLNQLK